MEPKGALAPWRCFHSSWILSSTSFVRPSWKMHLCLLAGFFALTMPDPRHRCDHVSLFAMQ
jgi:hypothetical protein